MILTKVNASKRFEKDLKRVPDFIQKKVLFWILLVESQGIAEASRSKGYHDEPLKGERKGQRSIRLNKAYRLIYRILKDRVIIELLEVNKHEY